MLARQTSGFPVAAILAWVSIASASTHTAVAAEVTLRDGTVLRGSVEQEGSFVRIDDGMRRMLVGTKRLAHVEGDDPFDASKPFRIPQPLAGRNLNEKVENLVAILKITPFDDFGRRTISVRDPSRGQIDIPQGITEINPEFVRVQSLKHLWESCIATQAIPSETLEAVLRRSIDPKNVDDRLRLTRFFLAAEWFGPAGRELKVIEQEFPAVADQVREAAGLLEQLKARRRLSEIKLRRSAGQHSFAYQYLREFPTQGAPGDVLTEVRDLVRQYDALVERMQQVQRELDKLFREVRDTERAAQIEPMLLEISQKLHVENLTRLDNFLSTASNQELAAEDRLALAISGWVVGSALAEQRMDRALRIWKARDLVQQYLVEPGEGRRERLLAEIRATEVSVDLVGHLLELLPPTAASGEIEPGRAWPLTTVGPDDEPVEYWVSLPAEYNPYHRYPLIMTLHAQGTTPEQQIAWWSSAPAYQASRNGYIVVAPAYVKDSAHGYRYDTDAHDTVLAALVDARRRFSIDSDRVFLTGHSMGGHAAWDIGLAHPDLFAGVIPICGSPQFFCEHYWPNGEHTSFCVVDGEKDGQGPAVNTAILERMMMNGHDALYVEYKGRGHENFSDETLRLFDWMGHKTRHRFPLSFSCRSARPTDNEFFWVSVGEFLPEVMMDPRVYDRKKIRPAQVEGKITGTANTIQLSLRGPKQAELWLSPGMVDLSQPVIVRLNGELKHRKPVAADLGVLLEDFRTRADRQKLFYARMSFPRI